MPGDCGLEREMVMEKSYGLKSEMVMDRDFEMEWKTPKVPRSCSLESEMER